MVTFLVIFYVQANSIFHVIQWNQFTWNKLKHETTWSQTRTNISGYKLVKQQCIIISSKINTIYEPNTFLHVDWPQYWMNSCQYFVQLYDCTSTYHKTETMTVYETANGTMQNTLIYIYIQSLVMMFIILLTDKLNRRTFLFWFSVLFFFLQTFFLGFCQFFSFWAFWRTRLLRRKKRNKCYMNKYFIILYLFSDRGAHLMNASWPWNFIRSPYNVIAV